MLQPHLCYFTKPMEQAISEHTPELQSSFYLQQFLMIKQKCIWKSVSEKNATLKASSPQTAWLNSIRNQNRQATSLNICTIPPRMERGFLTLATSLGGFLFHKCFSYCSAPSLNLFPSSPLAPCSLFCQKL